MKRIGTSDGRFVDGSRRVPGTPVSADWLNGMQEAIAQVLEHYDGQVDPENDRQLLDVLRHQVAARFESIAALRAFGGGRAGQAVDVAGYYAGRPGSGRRRGRRRGGRQQCHHHLQQIGCRRLRVDCRP